MFTQIYRNLEYDKGFQDFFFKLMESCLELASLEGSLILPFYAFLGTGFRQFHSNHLGQ